LTSRVSAVTDGGLQRIAYHEAGHVAAWRHFNRASFLERGYVLINTLGGYGQTGLGSGISWMSNQPPLIDHASIVTAMAGRAAEAIRHPDLDRAELAVLSATSDEPLARRYILRLYFRVLSDDKIDKIIEEAEVEASQILRGVWAGVRALAEKLEQKRRQACEEKGDDGTCAKPHVRPRLWNWKSS
jgi:hypothetical protein